MFLGVEQPHLSKDHIFESSQVRAAARFWGARTTKRRARLTIPGSDTTPPLQRLLLSHKTCFWPNHSHFNIWSIFCTADSQKTKIVIDWWNTNWQYKALSIHKIVTNLFTVYAAAAFFIEILRSHFPRLWSDSPTTQFPEQGSRPKNFISKLYFSQPKPM